MKEMSAMEAVGLALVVAILVFLCLPITEEFQRYSYAEYIYKYQTLITGILAVAAAFYTVKQMRESERQASSRHNEIIDITLRSDWLRIERAIHPQLNTIRRNLETLEGIQVKVSSCELSRRNLVQEDGVFAGTVSYNWAEMSKLTHANTNDVTNACSNILRCYKLDQFRDGEKLFRGKAVYYSQKSRDAIQCLLEFFEAIPDLYTSDPALSIVENFEQIKKDNFRKLPSILSVAIGSTKILVDELDTLRSRLPPTTSGP